MNYIQLSCANMNVYEGLFVGLIGSSFALASNNRLHTVMHSKNLPINEAYRQLLP